MLAASIQELVSIKIKPRHDGITDQYNRIFMVKICLICAAIIGVNYFSDKVSCIVANENGMDGGFVGSACWIQGLSLPTSPHTNNIIRGLGSILPRSNDVKMPESVRQVKVITSDH